MPKLPDTLGPTAIASPQRRIWSVDNTQVLEAEMRAGKRMEETGRDVAVFAEAYDKKQEKDALLESVRRDNEATREVNDLLYGTADTEGLYAARGASALDAQKTFDEKFKEIRNRALDGVTNPVAQVALEKSLMQLDTGTRGSLQRFVSEQRRGYTADILKNRSEINRQGVNYQYNDQGTVNKALENAEITGRNAAKLQGFAPGDGAFEQTVLKEKSAVLATQLNAMWSKNDPAIMAQGMELFDKYSKGNNLDFETRMVLDKTAAEVRPKVEAYKTFQKIGGGRGDDIEFVMQDLEGGDKLVPDGDGMARYGINSVANKDVDLTTLDKAGAKSLYKERYWDANGISELPPNMQLLAFDTAVNHRSDFKKEVLSAIKDGATQEDIFVMRLNEYERLAKANPEKYGKDLAGWKNRLSKLYDRVNGSAGMGVVDEGTAKSIASQLSPAAQPEFLSLVEANNAQIRGAQSIERKTVTAQAVDYLTQGGGYAAIPVELRARAEEIGVLKDIANYTGATDKNMAAFLYSMDPATLASTDLEDPSIRLKLSPADYQRWTAKKERLGDEGNLVTEERRKKLVNQAFMKRDINIDKKAGKETAVRYNELLDLEIDTFTKENKGRYPNEAELTKMVDGLFIKGDWDTNWWWGAGGKDQIFDIDVDDIPNSERAQIEAALQSSGVPVTDAAIIKTWATQNYGK